MVLSKVLLVGANGKLGSVVFDALLSAGSFQVSTLKRASSTSGSYKPSSVNIITVSATLPFEELKTAVKGQDAVIATFPLKNPDDHLRLAEACAAAGVKRFIPADFGSCDAADERARELVGLYRAKSKVQKRVEELAAENEGFTWTSIVCGHFFDLMMKMNLLGFDLDTNTAKIMDGGDEQVSASTLETVAEAVVKVLGMEEETKNKKLYVQSFCVSQNDTLRSLERATNAKWSIEHIRSENIIEDNKEKAAAGDKHALENLVFVVGQSGVQWEKKQNFANPMLGIKERDLNKVVDEVVSYWKVHGTIPLG